MKQVRTILTQILALIFIVISMYPCADKYEENNVSVSYTISLQTNIQTSTIEAARNVTRHQDACSPLCTCSCCSVFLTVTKPSSILAFVAVPINSKVNSIYQNLVGNLVFSIWQPPKLIG